MCVGLHKQSQKKYHTSSEQDTDDDDVKILSRFPVGLWCVWRLGGVGGLRSDELLHIMGAGGGGIIHTVVVPCPPKYTQSRHADTW